ncbi:enoyl-CoA hydratase [Ramlibacter sp. G-1-2-2]|uniref:Enoyl-CoA hydratase n=1 Tax=Ramlibacter agri TaxID=2728837 RepID=A0A848H2H5_9BURK|nr:enoyl-CoA hydratase-related protein [Ramlibacter agri]NML43340.1 enoyl-CoA hydratase [Ramlibacter agri]
MSADHLLVAVEDGVARLTFNRPEARNAASPEMLEALLAFLLRAEEDRRIRCIVLAGAGEHFMAGGDIRSFAQYAQLEPAQRRQAVEARVAKNTYLFNVLQRIPQPVIAMVHGTAAGAGVGFAVGCDLVVAGRSAGFQLAHVNIGACPDGGTSWFLPRAIGSKRAMAMALLGERLDATSALAQGLVSHVVDDAELETFTLALAHRLARGPAIALAQAKALIHRSLGSTLAEQLAAEARGMGAAAASEDFLEGPRAFLEKRKPVFRGE